MNKPVYIVAASRDDTTDHFIDETYSTWGKDSDVTFIRVKNNTKPLQKLYNDMLKSGTMKGSYVIFVHDDVYIDSYLNVKRVNDVFAATRFNVIGLAGCEKFSFSSPCLWHLNKDKHGVVNHSSGDSNDNTIEVFSTFFGKTPNRALVIDGVFMALDVDSCNDTKTLFDENCPSGFHFYDLDFSLTAHKNGLKTGVYPFSVVHRSHGLMEINATFSAGERYFIDKWSK